MTPNTKTHIHRIERMTHAEARAYIDRHGALDGVLVGERVATHDIIRNKHRGEIIFAESPGEFSALVSAFERRMRRERPEEGMTARIYRTIE